MLTSLRSFTFLVVLAFHSLAHEQSPHHHHHHHHGSLRDSPVTQTGEHQDRLLLENEENITYCGATDLYEKDFDAVKDIYDTYFAENDRRLQGGVTEIPVHIHIITDSRGRGDVSDDSINIQMEILNAAFAPTFAFSLVKTNRVANTEWFENCFAESSPQVRAMTSSLRQGGSGTLNMYTCNTPSIAQGVLLGRATFPFFYRDECVR